MITAQECTKLEGVAGAFLATVRDLWPQFIANAAVVDGSLVIRQPFPCGQCELWIAADVDFDEIIIGIGGGHSHGGDWRDPGSPEFDFRSSIDFIEGILAERVVACSLKNGGGAIGELDYLKSRDYWGEVVEVVSWLGTHNKKQIQNLSAHSRAGNV